MPDDRRMMEDFVPTRAADQDGCREKRMRPIPSQCYKAQQLEETYWLYVVWDPLGASPELVRIQNPAARLDHAKREIVAARYYEIPAEAIGLAGRGDGS
jgi:hypothetical protein